MLINLCSRTHVRKGSENKLQRFAFAAYYINFRLLFSSYTHFQYLFRVSNNFPDFLISEYVENIGLSEAYVGPLQYLRWGSL